MKSVFIIEDDDSIRILYNRLLSRNGFKISAMASNGAEAIKLYKTLPEKPDIILMDYRMPLKNGLETAKEILELDPTVKIMLTSADSAIKDEAFSIGITNFYLKPFKFDRLIEDMKNI